MITPVMLCPHHIVIQIFKKPKCGGGGLQERKKKEYIKETKQKTILFFF